MCTSWTRRQFLAHTAALGGVALAGASRRREAAGASPRVVRIGYIAQVSGLTRRPTANPAALEVAGYAGLLGAREGVEEMNYTARLMGERVDLVETTADSPPQALRQAERLVAQRAVALLGGFDPATALALSRFALERKILFFNVGTTDDRLTARCWTRTPRCGRARAPSRRRFGRKNRIDRGPPGP